MVIHSLTPLTCCCLWRDQGTSIRSPCEDTSSNFTQLSHPCFVPQVREETSSSITRHSWGGNFAIKATTKMCMLRTQKKKDQDRDETLSRQQAPVFIRGTQHNRVPLKCCLRLLPVALCYRGLCGLHGHLFQTVNRKRRAPLRMAVW